MKKNILFAGLCVAWCCIIGGIIVSYQSVFLFGEEILVPTQGVDPRDLFRGEYVRLGYLFDTVITNESVADLRESQYVWILPKMSGNVMIGIDSRSRQSLDSSHAIRAKIQYVNNYESSQSIIQWVDASGFVSWAEPNSFPTLYPPSLGDSLIVSACDWGVDVIDTQENTDGYGCEIASGTMVSYVTGSASFTIEYAPTRYYVEQGQGYDTEQSVRGGRAFARWYLWRGKAVLEGIFIR